MVGGSKGYLRLGRLIVGEFAFFHVLSEASLLSEEWNLTNNLPNWRQLLRGSPKANKLLLLLLLTNNAHKRLFQHKSHLCETAKQEKAESGNRCTILCSITRSPPVREGANLGAMLAVTGQKSKKLDFILTIRYRELILGVWWKPCSILWCGKFLSS